MDRVEHARIGEDDGDESCKIQAWRGRNLALSIAEVQTYGEPGSASQSSRTAAFIIRAGRDISGALAGPEPTQP